MIPKFFLVALCIFLFTPTWGFSETTEIVSEGVYNMGDGETPVIAEGKAVEQAKRFAIEQAGTFVKSYSKMKNFQIAEDEVQVLASGIMEVTVLDKKRTVTGDAIKFWVRIKAIVHPDKVEIMAEKIRDQGLAEDYAKMKDAYEKSQQEIDELKKQLSATKDQTDRRQIVAKITEQEKSFTVNQWFEKGMQHAFANRTDEAIDAFSQAITEDPNMLKAYAQRAGLYVRKQQHPLAVADFNRMIAINPDDPRSYTGRGLAYSKSGEHDKAIADLNKVLAINPDTPAFALSKIYTALGHSYMASGIRENAMTSFQKACKLGSQMACRQLKFPPGDRRPEKRPPLRDMRRRVP